MAWLTWLLLVITCEGKSILTMDVLNLLSTNETNITRNYQKENNNKIEITNPDCDKIVVEAIIKSTIQTKTTLHGSSATSKSPAEVASTTKQTSPTTTRDPLDIWCDCACLTGDAGIECDCPPPFG